jgi:DHA3 family macrolide efflux protein-like MFS transporter
VGVWGKAAFVLGATPGQLAILMFALSISAITGSLVAGALVDRFGPRRVLVAAEVVFVPAALAVALADDMTVLAILVSVWAFVGAPVVTAGASFAPFLTDDEATLTRLNSWIEGAGALSFAVGPAVGALVVRYADVDWVFVIDAVTSLIAAFLVLRVRLVREGSTPEERSGRPLADLLSGARTVYASRSLRYYVLAGSVVWMAFGAFGALEPLFFRDVVGAEIETMGWMNSVFGIGFMTGAALLPRLPGRIVSARGLGIMVSLAGLGTILYVGSADLRVIAAGAFAWSAVIGVLEPLLRTLMHRDSPKGLVGRVMGTAEVHRRAGELIPLAVAPTLAITVGVQTTLIGGGVTAPVIGLLSLFEARRIDREGGPPPEEPVLEGIRIADEPISPTP